MLESTTNATTLASERCSTNCPRNLGWPGISITLKQTFVSGKVIVETFVCIEVCVGKFCWKASCCTTLQLAISTSLKQKSRTRDSKAVLPASGGPTRSRSRPFLDVGRFRYTQTVASSNFESKQLTCKHIPAKSRNAKSVGPHIKTCGINVATASGVFRGTSIRSNVRVTTPDYDGAPGRLLTFGFLSMLDREHEDHHRRRRYWRALFDSTTLSITLVQAYPSPSQNTYALVTCGQRTRPSPNGLRAIASLTSEAVPYIYSRGYSKAFCMTFRNAKGRTLGKMHFGREEVWIFDVHASKGGST